MMDDEERNDPMVRIFPKVTKCIFHNFGVSGTIQKFDGLCILPINMVNDKIYILLWFWMVLLLVLSSCQMIVRFMTLLSGKVRILFIINLAPSVSNKNIECLQNILGFGDWLILTMMANHLDIKMFTDILNQIVSTHIEQKRHSSLRFEEIHKKQQFITYIFNSPPNQIEKRDLIKGMNRGAELCYQTTRQASSK